MLLFVSAVVWLIIESSKPEVLPIGSKAPAISFVTLSGIKTVVVDNENKTLIIFFSKECPHCKYELSVLNNNTDKLIGTKIYLLTSDKDFLHSEDIKNYSNLLENNNITFGIVNKEEYKTKFGRMVTPTLFFFNEKGILTAKLKGETKLERILKELNKQSFRNPGKSADVRKGGKQRLK